MTDGRKARILLVDQDLGALTSLDALLAREGYPVSTCSTPAEAFRAVGRKGIDLVIAGTKEAERHCLDLVWQVAKLAPATRVLLLMEPQCRRDYQDLVAAGATGLLKKPYSETQLLDRVATLVAEGPRPIPAAIPAFVPPEVQPPGSTWTPPGFFRAGVVALVGLVFITAAILFAVKTSAGNPKPGPEIRTAK